jgi:outer membrane protein TolC
LRREWIARQSHKNQPIYRKGGKDVDQSLDEIGNCMASPHEDVAQISRPGLAAASCGSLVANVATGYFQLRELDLELEISRSALSSRQESLHLVSTQEQHGSTSMLDVRRAEQLVYTASSQIPDLERRIQQQENFLSILRGRYPGPIPRGQTLTEQAHPPQIPSGVPSTLLERRPDNMQAEQHLIAQNAEIGVARAAPHYLSSRITRAF